MSEMKTTHPKVGDSNFTYSLTKAALLRTIISGIRIQAKVAQLRTETAGIGAWLMRVLLDCCSFEDCRCGACQSSASSFSSCSQDSGSRFGINSINSFDELGDLNTPHYIYPGGGGGGGVKRGPTDMILTDIISPALDSQHHWPVLPRGSNHGIHPAKIKVLGI